MPYQYSLYKRTRNSTSSDGTVNSTSSWTAQFLDQCGRQGKQYSVSSLAKKLAQPLPKNLTKVWAERICDLALSSGLIGDEGTPQSLNLREYLIEYWTPGTELFERRTKLKNNKHQYSARKNIDSLLVHVFHSDRNTKKNGKVIGFYLPDNLLVSQLTREHCQKLQDSVLLTKGLSAKSWLNILDALNPPLNRLVKEDVIRRNPF